MFASGKRSALGDGICQLASNALCRKCIDMKRTRSPSVTAEMAAHIRYLVHVVGLFQHQAAALMGINPGRVNEVVKLRRWPGVQPARGPFPV